MFTDVVGYSALMQRAEAATIAGVQADFARMRELCEQQGGEVLNTMGDGMMLCFPSALEALGFALQMQSGFAARDSSASPAPLQHRVGIHLGDVFRLDDGHVAGDGVNIAARLESKAPVGGICISQTVYDTVKGKLPVQATFMGPQHFKNIAEPIPVWHIAPEGGSGVVAEAPLPVAAKQESPLRSKRVFVAGAGAAVAASIAGAAYWWRRELFGGAAGTVAGGPDNKSIAVLPFTNMSADKEAAYFADGIHEDLLTQLALLSELKVVSRTSVMEYRNSAKNMRQIGKELGVGSLVEGSVRRAGNQVRVTAQLIDAGADRHVWAKNYDRDLKDIFAVQSELATQIAGALRVSLSATEQTRLARKPTENLEAYDLFLRAQELASSVGSYQFVGSVPERLKLLERVVELDPKFALAWARLGNEHGRAFTFNVDPTRARVERATKAVEHALKLAPGDPQVKIEEGAFFLQVANDPARAAKAYQEVLQLSPFNVPALIGMAGVRHRLGETAAAVAAYESVLGIDPRNARVLNVVSSILKSHRYFDRSAAYRKQLIDLRPDDVDLQAHYHHLQYLASGSWDSYDKWRATLPPGAEAKSLRVRNVDRDRAMARRDFATALRLVSLRPDDFKDMMGSSSGAQALSDRAAVLFASGDRAGSVTAARLAMASIEAELAKTPEDLALHEAKAVTHAMLGQRAPAFAALAKAVELSTTTGKVHLTQGLRDTAGDLHALLGERKEAIAIVRQQLKRPGSYVHEIRTGSSFVPLADDPEFKALVGDPANNAPLPLTAKY